MWTGGECFLTVHKVVGNLMSHVSDDVADCNLTQCGVVERKGGIEALGGLEKDLCALLQHPESGWSRKQIVVEDGIDVVRI
jgi:hypothetical protein